MHAGCWELTSGNNFDLWGWVDVVHLKMPIRTNATILLIGSTCCFMGLNERYWLRVLGQMRKNNSIMIIGMCLVECNEIEHKIELGDVFWRSQKRCGNGFISLIERYWVRALPQIARNKLRKIFYVCCWCGKWHFQRNAVSDHVSSTTNML